MVKDIDEDILLRRYLLGQLTPEERLPLDSRLFLDDEYAEKLKLAETELIDDYLYGDLNPEQRRSFDDNFLGQRERQESFIVARALQEYLRNNPTARMAAKPSRWAAFAWSGWRPASWQVATTASALLLLTGGAWMLLRQARTNTLLEPSHTSSLAGNRDSSDPSLWLSNHEVSVPGNSNQTVPERTRDNSTRLPRLKNPSLKPTEPADGTRAITIMLTTTVVTRTNDPYPNSVNPGSAATVDLQLPLVDGFERGRFSAGLFTGDGRKLSSWPGLRVASPSPPLKFVTVKIPSRLLTPEKYKIELSVVGSDGTLQVVRTYYFYVPNP